METTGAHGGHEADWAAREHPRQSTTAETDAIGEAHAAVTVAVAEIEATPAQPAVPADDVAPVVERARWISSSDQSTLASSFALSARRLVPPRRFSGLHPIMSAALLTAVLALVIASCVGAVRLEQMGRNLLSQPAPHATTTPHVSPTKTVAPKK